MVLFQAMSSFPPKEWRVRYLKDMQHLACEAIEEDEISMAAYMAVRPSEGEEGSYRFRPLRAGQDQAQVSGQQAAPQRPLRGHVHLGRAGHWRPDQDGEELGVLSLGRHSRTGQVPGCPGG